MYFLSCEEIKTFIIIISKWTNLVPLDQRSETRETLGATISGMRIDAECASLRSEIGWAELGYFVCYSKWLLPESLVFWPLVKGNEDSGNELVRGLVTWRQQFMKRVTWVRHNLIKKKLYSTPVSSCNEYHLTSVPTIVILLLEWERKVNKCPEIRYSQNVDSVLFKSGLHYFREAYVLGFKLWT